MKILLAADGSKYTRNAAKFIATFASSLKDAPEVFVHHVHPPFPYPGAISVVGKKAVEDYARDESRKALDVAGRELGAANIAFVEQYTVSDSVPREIAEVAKRRGADIVVVGSHGHGALAGLAMGSVTAKLIATLPVPVLVVR